MLKYIKNHAASIEGINIYPIFSLLVFVLFFIGVIWYVRRMDRSQVDEVSHLPLDLTDENVLNPAKTASI